MASRADAMDPAVRESLSATFDAAAGRYAASRPGYPDSAVDWLLGGGSGDVLDLGAGSGTLSRALVARGARRVVAADPSRNLLHWLRPEAPSAIAVQAGAEYLPFADASFDVVTVATAFHWFDAQLAVPEIARVLRSGGYLGLVWNTRDLTESWTHALDRLLREAQPPALRGDWGTSSVHALDGSDVFEALEYVFFPHAQRLSREGLLDLVASRSYVIALDAVERRQLLLRIAALFDAHAESDGTLELPYRTQCWRTVVRRAASA